MPALELKQYRALQEAVPRGELILARLDRIFFLILTAIRFIL